MSVEGEAARLVTGTPVSFICTTKTSLNRHMNNSFCPRSTTPATGESFDEVVLPHLDAAFASPAGRCGMNTMPKTSCRRRPCSPSILSNLFRRQRSRIVLRIVRNTCWSWRDHSVQPLSDPFDEEQHSSARPASDPEALLLQTDDVDVDRASDAVTCPIVFVELLVLRELEGLSYRELADEMGIPMGTVMSSLSRARQALPRSTGARRLANEEERVSPVRR